MNKRVLFIVIGVVAAVVIAGGVYVALTLTGENEAEARAGVLRERLSEITTDFSFDNPRSTIGTELAVDNLKMTLEEGNRIVADNLEIAEFDWDRPEKPRFLEMKVKGMQVVPSAELRAAADEPFMRALGIFEEDIKTDVDVRYRIDEDAKTVELEYGSKAEKLGESFVFMKFGNFEMQGLDGENRAEAQRAAMSMTLIRAEVRYRDETMVERMLKGYAEKEGITPDEARAQVINQLRQARAGAKDSLSKEFLDAAITFIENPGEIRVAAEPPSPFPLSAFLLMAGNPDRLKRQLGLTITVTQGG